MVSLFAKSAGRVLLTSDGVEVAERAQAALAILQKLARGPRPTTIRIGARPEIGLSWLALAIFRMRISHPDIIFHVEIGLGSDLLQLLEEGALDAVLTLAPNILKRFQSMSRARICWENSNPGRMHGNMSL
jgi:DNA-binding transcriptional LysR family regulator